MSPRKRARQTFELLLGPTLDLIEGIEGKLTYTEDIAEWDYGDYEGLKNDEIRSLRQKRGHDTERKWDIWTDGCEGGEYVMPGGSGMTDFSYHQDQDTRSQSGWTD